MRTYQKRTGTSTAPGPNLGSPRWFAPKALSAALAPRLAPVMYLPRTYQVIVISEGQALLKIAWDGMGWGPVRGIGFASCDPLFFPYERLTACGAEG